MFPWLPLGPTLLLWTLGFPQISPPIRCPSLCPWCLLRYGTEYLCFVHPKVPRTTSIVYNRFRTTRKTVLNKSSQGLLPLSNISPWVFPFSYHTARLLSLSLLFPHFSTQSHHQVFLISWVEEFSCLLVTQSSLKSWPRPHLRSPKSILLLHKSQWFWTTSFGSEESIVRSVFKSSVYYFSFTT